MTKKKATTKKAASKKRPEKEPTLRVRAVAEWLMEWAAKFEASEKQAARDKLWPVAGEYRSRWTTVDMLLGSLERGEVAE